MLAITCIFDTYHALTGDTDAIAPVARRAVNDASGELNEERVVFGPARERARRATALPIRCPVIANALVRLRVEVGALLLERALLGLARVACLIVTKCNS